MSDEYKEYISYLENCTYRNIQQRAKSMGLPCNYKKVYLIELIYAKKFRSEDIVQAIIQKVKIERLLSYRSKNKSNKRINITSSNRSPPITITPKGPKVYLPDVQRVVHNMKQNSRRSLLNDIEQHNQTLKPSDRVLRSYNLRKTNTPNYKIMNINNIQNNISTNISNVNTQTGSFYNYFVTTECVAKKHRPAILSSSCNSETRESIISRKKNVVQNNNCIAARRQRTVSGIYPLVVYKKFPQNVHTTEGVLMRKSDGSFTKINALIQKSNTNYKQRIAYCNTDINIQDIIESIEDNNENTNDDSQIYPAVQSDTMPSQSTFYPQMENNYRCNERDAYSNYHLDTTRQQTYKRNPNDKQILPKIEVFSKFNNMKQTFQPLYVQVSTESELSQNCPLYGSKKCNTALLECLYNFKSEMLTNVPLLQVATTANTKSVFSTTTVTTPMAHPSSHGTDASFNSCEQDRYTSDTELRVYEYFGYSEQQMRQNTGMACDQHVSSDALPGRDTPATIPEMLDDAVELISQDGDYMEQIGMDVRVCCVVCPWAGPSMLLENHVLKEHSSAVVEAHGGEWSVSWSLGALAIDARAFVLRHNAALYVLRAHYRDPEQLAAHLASISADPAPKSGVITVYNKVSGQPYTWRGYIQPLTGEAPELQGIEGLQVDISHLDLLPNSANLRLYNRELVSDSQTKAIVGAPALNDIDIVMYVKIF